MPGNALAFTIRVGGQINGAGFFGQLLELGDLLRAALGGNVLGNKSWGGNPNLFFWHIPYMADAGGDRPARPQDRLDFLDLAGRFNDQ